MMRVISARSVERALYIVYGLGLRNESSLRPKPRNAILPLGYLNSYEESILGFYASLRLPLSMMSSLPAPTPIQRTCSPVSSSMRRT